MKLLQLISATVAGFCLTACATDYHENQQIGGFYTGGYSDTRLNANTAVVSFAANNKTPIQLVRTYLLYRCAQVAAGNGFNYFIVTSMSSSVYNTKIVEGYRQRVTNPPRLYQSSYWEPKYIYSYISPTANPDMYRNDVIMEDNNHKATAVIKMFQGRKPNLPNAYSVEDVLAHNAPSTL
jgi:hypothetical protein